MQWLDAITLERLNPSGKTAVRRDVGYPLAESALDGCTLTCH